MYWFVFISVYFNIYICLIGDDVSPIFCSAFLNLRMRNDTMPVERGLNSPTSIVFFVLYKICVVFLLYTFVVCVLYFSFCMKLSLFFHSFGTKSKTSMCWCDHLPDSGQFCNQIWITWSLLAYPEEFPTIVLPQIFFLSFFIFLFFESQSAPAESKGKTEINIRLCSMGIVSCVVPPV